MDKTVTLTSDEIVNITSAIEDRIILLEDFISNHAYSHKAHKRLKEFKEIKAMDKTITLTSDDICVITLALLDKAMNIKNSAKICGITLSSQTLNKLASMQELVNKIND